MWRRLVVACLIGVALVCAIAQFVFFVGHLVVKFF